MWDEPVNKQGSAREPLRGTRPPSARYGHSRPKLTHYHFPGLKTNGLLRVDTEQRLSPPKGWGPAVKVSISSADLIEEITEHSGGFLNDGRTLFHASGSQPFLPFFLVIQME